MRRRCGDRSQQRRPAAGREMLTDIRVFALIGIATTREALNPAPRTDSVIDGIGRALLFVGRVASPVGDLVTSNQRSTRLVTDPLDLSSRSNRACAEAPLRQSAEGRQWRADDMGHGCRGMG